MKCQFFYRSESNRRSWEEQSQRPAFYVTLELSANLGFDALLQAALASGMPRGSSRSGCFEVQTDNGIWCHQDPAVRARGYGRLSQATAIFKTWEELEREEQ
jgi:hypothetical protein